MLQAQPENILFEIKQRMQMPRQPLPDAALASLCVSYPKTRSFGLLDLSVSLDNGLAVNIIRII